MTLLAKINAYEEVKKQKVPEEILNTMDRATDELKATDLENQGLKAGDIAPDFTLSNQNGESLSLSSLTDDSIVILSFYRGAWCPYCNLELSELQSHLGEFKERGARLVAVSPQTPDNSLTTIEKNELAFDILSDQENKIAREFGLVFTLPESLKPIYDKFGIDIPAHNGDGSFELPVPATYVIGKNREIIFDFIDADYTTRLEPSIIVNILDNLK
ncbi:MAG: AhpC/TSA family protein [Gammaproteobacteria bacterium]|nr:AhpC/TSA family protein [Gammaproteobacteria bacterium]